jgi:hypothetical protein
MTIGSQPAVYAFLVKGGEAPDSVSGGLTAKGVQVDCGHRSNLCETLGNEAPLTKNRIYLRFRG